MNKFFEHLKNVRYQKFVTTFLYLSIFVVIAFTFWEYYFVGETVGSEVYEKTLDTLLGLLGITGGMKIGETASEAFEKVAALKYSVGSNMRGGE